MFILRGSSENKYYICHYVEAILGNLNYNSTVALIHVYLGIQSLSTVPFQYLMQVAWLCVFNMSRSKII